jgi:uncharacterized hydrophobic protein (TIGR00271 family)
MDVPRRLFGWLRKLQPDFKDLEAIYSDLYQGRQFDAVYAIMLVLSCLIALLGLLVNSPAVIIGAMLISPLMGPILSCGLALTLAEWTMGWKAARNVAFSVLEAVLIAALATALSPLREATPEILARSNPNLMDLLIAFFSGVAGVLALTSRKPGLTIIPGVAIATAVMPPLATTGYGLATGQWGIFRGSFLLFFTNLAAIIISADLVFLFVGFRPRHRMLQHEHHIMVRYRILAATLILAVISAPLLRTLLSAARQARVRQEITRTLRSDLQRPGISQVSGIEFDLRDGEVSIEATLRTTEYVQLSEVRRVEERLARLLDRKVQLHLEQVRVEQDPAAESARLRNFVASVIGPQPPPARSASELLLDLENRTRRELEPLLQPVGVLAPQVRSISLQEGNLLVLEVTGTGSRPLEPDALAVAAASLARGSSTRLQLRVSLRVAPGEATPPPDLVSFAPRSAIPDRADLARARAWLAPWRERGDLLLTLQAPTGVSEPLTARRLAALRRSLPLRSEAAPAQESSLAADTWRLRLQQELTAGGEPPAPPAASPAPSK